MDYRTGKKCMWACAVAMVAGAGIIEAAGNVFGLNNIEILAGLVIVFFVHVPFLVFMGILLGQRRRKETHLKKERAEKAYWALEEQRTMKEVWGSLQIHNERR